METASVIKRGETCIDTSLRRTFDGLTIDVKVHPGIEEFMRLRGNGEVTPVSAIGRHWTAPDKNKPLTVYAYGAMEQLRGDDGTIISLEKVGHPLLELNDRGASVINISFLRLVGASEGAGVRFSLKGVFSDKHLRQLRESLGSAQKKFYIEYLRPIDLRVTISTADLVV